MKRFCFMGLMALHCAFWQMKTVDFGVVRITIDGYDVGGQRIYPAFG
jgi:hypothetical protein